MSGICCIFLKKLQCAFKQNKAHFHYYNYHGLRTLIHSGHRYIKIQHYITRHVKFVTGNWYVPVAHYSSKFH